MVLEHANRCEPNMSGPLSNCFPQLYRTTSSIKPLGLFSKVLIADKYSEHNGHGASIFTLEDTLLLSCTCTPTTIFLSAKQSGQDDSVKRPPEYFITRSGSCKESLQSKLTELP